MKSAPAENGARAATLNRLRDAADCPFRITNIQLVSYAGKVGEFSIETPLGVINADLFAPVGREPLVTRRSIRDDYTGRWRRTFVFDRAFAARVLDVLRERVSTLEKQKPAAHQECPAKPAAHSGVLLDREHRFLKMADAHV